MSHGNKGRKGKGSGKLPVIPGLPVMEEVTEDDLRHIGQRTHAAEDRGSISKFSVPTRAKAIRRAGLRDRQKAGKSRRANQQPRGNA